jgi:hypothetical protein
MFISKKFILIDKIKQSKEYGALIPEFLQINRHTSYADIRSFLRKEPCILRSSLLGEGEVGQIQSGRSLSFKNIKSFEDYKLHYQKILKQERMNCCILQKEIVPLVHYTGCRWGETLFVENTHTKDQISIYTTKNKSGNLNINSVLIRNIFQVLDFLSTEKNFLFEFGISNEKLFIFQINELNQQTSELMTNGFLKNFMRFQKNVKKKYSFFELIKIEYQAFKFRKNYSSMYGVFEIWLNWKYMFHYYYLFCLTHKAEATPQLWVAFLKKKNSTVIAHLKIANELSLKHKGLATEHFIEPSFEPTIFFGSGQKNCNVDDCWIAEELTPEVVYKHRHKVFLIRSAHSLSHSVLALIELNCLAVLNLNDENWTRLKNKQNVTIDFDKNLIS